MELPGDYTQYWSFVLQERESNIHFTNKNVTSTYSMKLILSPILGKFSGLFLLCNQKFPKQTNTSEATFRRQNYFHKGIDEIKYV